MTVDVVEVPDVDDVVAKERNDVVVLVDSVDIVVVIETSVQ